MGWRRLAVRAGAAAVLALTTAASRPARADAPATSPATSNREQTQAKPEKPTKPEKPWTHRGDPILVLATGPLLGPHAFGNEECRSEESECQVRGTFFGLGLNVELRARLYRILHAHVRPWVVGNVSNRGPIYRGMVGGGFGLGVYGQHAFLRGEYIALLAFGDNHFEPPFFEGEVGTDTFGRHAGLVSAGFRRQLSPRAGIELWVGPMFGPKAERRIPGQDPDRRLLVTFMLGVNASFDLVGDNHP